MTKEKAGSFYTLNEYQDIRKLKHRVSHKTLETFIIAHIVS